MGQITFTDLLSQETKRDPVAFSARLREQGPLIHLTSPFSMGESWIVTTYDDTIAVLKDPRFIKDTHKVSKPWERQDAAGENASVVDRFLTWRRDMLTVDPPDHTRLRGLVSKAFTPRMIEQLRPRIQQIADELLEAVQAQGRMDLIVDFAFPLPITVISEMLGIPAKDRQQFRVWSQTIVNVPMEPQMEDKLAALEMFVQYIKTLLADKSAHPGSDLTSGLVQAEERGDSLNEAELISTIFLLIVAGHETTVNLIGNGMLALLEHPEQMRLLRADPSLLPSAIEELLRYTAPVSLSSPRWASEDIPMHGQVIRKGDMVFVSLIGADTDPQQFPDPEVLNILRQENQHVAFGKGIHYCLGAPLARLEGQIAIGTLLQRLPNLRQAEGAHSPGPRIPSCAASRACQSRSRSAFLQPCYGQKIALTKEYTLWNIFSIIVGTAIAVIFAIYIGSR